MTLSELVSLLKRTTRIGDINVTSDRITTDLILFINNRRFSFWRKWYWDWSAEEISVSVAANASEFTLGSTIGGVLVLYISGEADYLRPVSFKRYLQWQKTKADEAGSPTRYIKLGRDSSGNLKYKLWKTPSEAVTVKGWGKKRLTKYAVADIATNTGLEFFPEETHDILFEGVKSDIYALQDLKTEAVIQEARFKIEIEKLIEDEENQPDEEIQSPPPDLYIFNKRKRGGTTVA